MTAEWLKEVVIVVVTVVATAGAEWIGKRTKALFGIKAGTMNMVAITTSIA